MAPGLHLKATLPSHGDDDDHDRWSASRECQVSAAVLRVLDGLSPPR